MVRIDIASDGLTSIREPNEPLIGNSMTVLPEVKDRRTAEMIVVTLCKLMYEGSRDRVQAAGFSGYVYPMPDPTLPVDDLLGLIQEAFKKTLKVFDKP
jgi:hypothetical protein